MLKLYRIEPKSTLYWETWDNGDGSHTVHWGELGKKGASKTVRRFLFQTADEKVKAEAEQRLAEGYKPIDLGDHRVLRSSTPSTASGTPSISTSAIDSRAA